MNNVAIVTLGVSAMLLMAMGVILFVVLYQRRVIQSQIEIERINRDKQQEMLNASIQSEEQERMRIAAELHDDIAPTLASVKLYLATATRREDPKAAGELLLQSGKLLDESLRKIRDIAHKLQPSTLYYLGLETSLQALSDMLQQSGSITATYTCNHTLPPLPEHLALSFYRICQELTNNIIKHAQAGHIEIGTELGDETLTLTISHNGTGITQHLFEELVYKKGAIGLKNIVSRLKSINARINFEQVSVSLFTITVQAPIKAVF